jgi:hypothetical protein
MKFIVALCICSLFFQACSVSVDEKKLTGTWEYIRIENLNPASQDSTTTADLKMARPFIQFKKNSELQIYWSDKVLSSGTYHVDGSMIRYKEDLSDGQQREFPFLVKKLTDDELIFETMSREGTRVFTRKKE